MYTISPRGMEIIEEQCRLERERQSMRVKNVPKPIIDMVMDFEEEFKQDFIKRIQNGDSYELSLSVVINLIYLKRLSEKDEEINKLKENLAVNKKCVERLFNSYAEANGENAVLLEKIKDLYHNMAFSKFIMSQNSEEILRQRTKLTSETVKVDDLRNKVAKLEQENKSLKQEVNDCHWLGKKPYKI